MVSIIWNPKFGGQGIIYKYILNFNDCTFEHGRVLGRTNSKNRYKAIQNVRYLESEEQVFKKATKNVTGRGRCSQERDATHSNKFCAHFFRNLSFASLYLIRLG